MRSTGDRESREPAQSSTSGALGTFQLSNICGVVWCSSLPVAAHASRWSRASTSGTLSIPPLPSWPTLIELRRQTCKATQTHMACCQPDLILGNIAFPICRASCAQLTTLQCLCFVVRQRPPGSRGACPNGLSAVDPPSCSGAGQPSI